MVCRSVRKVHDEIASSPLPSTPLIFSEYNASYANEPNVTDTVYMGPWLATTISQCDGLTESMSYWTFSDVFEEQGVVRTPFYGGFGLLAADSIPKPAFNAFAMLHQLGDKRLAARLRLCPRYASLRRRTRYRALELCPARRHRRQLHSASRNTRTGKDLHPQARWRCPPTHRRTILRLDEDHGNVIKTYDAMGRPAFPPANRSSNFAKPAKPLPPEQSHLKNSSLTIQVPSQGLVLSLSEQ